MRYRWFRSRGLLAGSGVVESGCKAVIGQRLKLSGMRWTITGADAIATRHGFYFVKMSLWPDMVELRV